MYLPLEEEEDFHQTDVIGQLHRVATLSRPPGKTAREVS
jgi:hypothetical protein